MLILTRCPNQSIVIETTDGTITIDIKAVKGNQVRLSFNAPDAVEIWREELLDEEVA